MDAQDFIGQISDAFSELNTLRKTHVKSLEIIEEHRREIWELNSKISDLKKQISELKGKKDV